MVKIGRSYYYNIVNTSNRRAIKIIIIFDQLSFVNIVVLVDPCMGDIQGDPYKIITSN